MLDSFKKISFEVWGMIFTAVVSASLFSFGAMKHSTDDSFILFRYIDNITLGNGFVYNIGEKILGATTPLFTIIGALFKYLFVFIDTPILMAGINIALLSTSSIFFYKVSRHFLSPNLSFLSVIVFALNLSKIVPEGMETGLFILTLFAFLHYLLNGRNYISAVFLSLIVLTRPDAGLIAVIAFVYWWQKYGLNKTIRYTLTTVSVALPWLIFSTLYFGSFIPQSLLTKLHLEDIVNLERFQALKVQLASMSRLYIGKIYDPNNLILQSIFNLIPFLVLVFLGIRRKINTSNWIIFAIPLAYFVTYSISNPVMWPWYVSQMEPMWILISFMGISVVFEKLQNFKLKIFFVLLVLSGPFFFWMSGVLNNNPGHELDNIPVAQYISERMSKGDSVGINNIGVFSFYLKDAYIVDFFGLTNDYAVNFYPVEGECIDKSRLYNIPPKLIEFKEPDWIVLSGEGELDPCFVAGKWFQSKYIKEPFVTDTATVIWRKK